MGLFLISRMERLYLLGIMHLFLHIYSHHIYSHHHPIIYPRKSLLELCRKTPLPTASCWLQPMGCTDWEWGGWEDYEVRVIVSCRLAVVVFFATPQDSYCSVALYYSYSLTYNYCFPRFQKQLSPLGQSGLVTALHYSQPPKCCTIYLVTASPSQSPRILSWEVPGNPLTPQQVWVSEGFREYATKLSESSLHLFSSLAEE